MNKKIMIILFLSVFMLFLPTAKAGVYLEKTDTIYYETESVLSLNLEQKYNATTFFDYSLLNNHGKDYNTIQEENGIYGECRKFDALDNKNITVAHDETINFSGIYAEFTIMFWFKPSTIVSYDDILAKNINYTSYNYGIRRYSDELRFYWASDIVYRTTTDINLVVNIWYHIVFIFNDNIDKVFCYVNGTSKDFTDTSNTYNIHTIENNKPFTIGVFNNSTNYCNGYIDEVRIFDYALTQKEIETYMTIPIETSLKVQGLSNNDVVQLLCENETLYEQQISNINGIVVFDVFDFSNKCDSYEGFINVFHEDTQYYGYLMSIDWGDIYTFLVLSAYEDLFVQLFFGTGAWLGILILILGSLFALKLYKYTAIIFSTFFVLLGLQYYQAFSTGLDDLIWFWVFCWVMPVFLIFAMFKIKR